MSCIGCRQLICRVEKGQFFRSFLFLQKRAEIPKLSTDLQPLIATSLQSTPQIKPKGCGGPQNRRAPPPNPTGWGIQQVFCHDGRLTPVASLAAEVKTPLPPPRVLVGARLLYRRIFAYCWLRLGCPPARRPAGAVPPPSHALRPRQPSPKV